MMNTCRHMRSGIIYKLFTDEIKIKNVIKMRYVALSGKLSRPITTLRHAKVLEGDLEKNKN